MIDKDDHQKLYDDFDNRRLERRAFLRGLATAGGFWLWADILGPPVVKQLQAKVSDFLQRIDGHPYNAGLVKQLFGDFHRHTRFTPGSSHYLFSGQIPPDDRAAMATIDQICRTVTDRVEVVNGYFPSIDFRGTFVCTGSPVSNMLSRLVMQYQRTQHRSAYGFVREHEPVLDLRYEYILDPRYLQSAAHKERVGRGRVLNWSILDQTENNVFWPQVDKNTFLRTDYLLITVIPNIIERESFERGDKIIIFGGTHGPGTRAVDTLFRDESVLKHLLQKVGGIKCWQALLEVDQIFHEDGVDYPFSLSRNIHCSPVNINEAALRKWFEQLPV
jgi:hypothetical protein